MAETGLATFDKMLQTTNLWLKDIEGDGIADHQMAWKVLGAGLRTIRDRLPVELAAHFGAQLPTFVRGAYYDQFRPSDMPGTSRTLDEFLDEMEGHLDRTAQSLDTRQALEAVFGTVSHYIDPGEVRKVREALPSEVRELWPDPDTRH